MDPNDKELMEQLARDPFPRNGFDARLRKRIEERLENGQGRRLRKSWWRIPAAMAASVCLLMLGFWLWNAQDAGRSDNMMNASQAQPATQAPVLKRTEAPVRYAVLIGLRTDPQPGSDEPSTYRTVLVADEEGQGPMKYADNTGLKVPFGQHFMAIDNREAGKGRQYLEAIRVTNNKKQTPPSREVPGTLLSEKILFSGNHYISLRTKHRGRDGKEIEYYWVKTLDMVNDKASDPGLEPHVRLEGVLPERESKPPVEQWYVMRNPGQWVADVPAQAEAAATAGRFPAQLPWVVVNADRLTSGWEQILELEPGARDAFSYGNLLGVVTRSEIVVREIEGTDPTDRKVSIPLKERESVIMLQYAEGQYVQRWIRDMGDMGTIPANRS